MLRSGRSFERRTFLKLMGASLALVDERLRVSTPEKIVPYVRQPRTACLAKPVFATALTLGGFATPLLAEVTKAPKAEEIRIIPTAAMRPADRGFQRHDIFSQASILVLYDPDRSQNTLYRVNRGRGQPRRRDSPALDEQRPKQGAGLRFLTETITSPTLAAQLKGIFAEFPQAKWHQYEPVNNDNARGGAVMAFGQPLNTIYDFSKADCILSLDADFLAALPGTLRYARDFAARRRITEGKKEMSRLYVIETHRQQPAPARNIIGPSSRANSRKPRLPSPMRSLEERPLTILLPAIPPVVSMLSLAILGSTEAQASSSPAKKLRLPFTRWPTQ